MADDGDELLRHVLGEIQRRGGIGPVAIAEAIAHSDSFVAACPDDLTAAADLGSGGGLPGLVLAVRLPGLAFHLIERRATRADLLRFGVAALGLGGRVEVHGEDVASFAARGVPIDLVTARSFASSIITLRAAAAVLGPAGWVFVSDPPTPFPVRPADLTALSLSEVDAVGGIRRYRR